MMAYTHISFALLCILVFIIATGTPLTPTILTIAVLFALLPDIDHPKSFIGRVVPAVSTFIYQVVGHRSFTHSFMAFYIVVMFSIALFGWSEAVAPVIIGYASHILIDMLNENGVELLFPKRERIRLSLVKVDSIHENILMISMTMVSIIILYLAMSSPLVIFL